MKVTTLAILDRNQGYMERAADYMRKTAFGQGCRIRLFSYPESLESVVGKEGEDDLLLVSADSLPNEETVRRFRCVISFAAEAIRFIFNTNIRKILLIIIK